jgi:hypothetical protein
LESARFEDVWKYLTLKDIQAYFPKLKLKPGIRQTWAYALQVWEEHG